MDAKKTGLLISEMRKEKGLTQKELAAKLHVSDRTISKWERGVGFPDVTMLGPLSDELGIPVQCLLNGERETCTDMEHNGNMARSEGTVRDIIKIACEQYRKKSLKNISTVLAAIFLIPFLGFIILVALEYSGAFQKEISCEIPAFIYENGVKTGETVVVIDGSLRTAGEKSFQGKFYIEGVETTGREQVSGYITWDRIVEGYQEIRYYRPGNLELDAGIKRDLYISPDMQQFALELKDGRIVATNDCLAKLQAIEECRYAISYGQYYHSSL